ncbi:ABC transporter permease [Mesoplasma lactucae]|uniref:ABC3 transporter permease C-terminal domain-containing protein n=1 Tax=Mesoplasma lactucae ATCC 49193 TaxID=81460 RepID=A0A291ISW0_9MOLU|nr:ABC transporter permease [Mesoplasma lactucae]ATG97781.1 hypothetical protein CP520_03525 [Mesoplasma lactucae ATCC 49193]ATZ20442.1 hypothetical protein MLACT_v1c06210 [Mesoplasma lactucae ATCC 49193]MCL8216614.1 hypothetical protein [Mesoplasma lactucae ATCC 49193]
MSFKLLVKQAFKNISNKFRLYISLVLFLIVSFSIVNGLTTFMAKFGVNMLDIVNKYNQTNSQYSAFAFLDKDSEDNPEYLYKLSDSGQEEFENYLAMGINEMNSSYSVDDAKKFLIDNKVIQKLGENQGDVSLLNTFEPYYKELNDWSRYYSHNLLLQFLSEKYFPENIKGFESGFLGTEMMTANDYDNPGIQVSLGVSEQFDESLPNPFRKETNTKRFNNLYHFKQNDISKKKDINKSLPQFYVTSNYFRLAKKHIGDEMEININSKIIKGQIAGAATSNTSAIMANGIVDVYVPQTVFSDIVGSQYISDLTLSAWVPIEGSTGVYNNLNELITASNILNKTLLGEQKYALDNDVKQPLFLRTSGNGQNGLAIQNPIRAIDQSTFPFAKYHTPLKIYKSTTIFIDIALLVLTLLVAVFIIQEAISSEKKTLWFLKAMGENNAILSLVNAFSVFVPLLVALGASVAGTMLMMWFLEEALLSQYAFTINWYQLTWVTFGILILFLVGTLFVFFLINFAIVSGKGLSLQSSGNEMSKFQIFLAKVTDPLTKHASPQFRIGFAFVRQNFAKNVVTFILFTILFTVTLFGVQFNHSISMQKDSYAKWMGSYQSTSTMYPKNVLNIDKTSTSYETIDANKFKSNQDEEKKQINDEHSNESVYDYDLFYYFVDTIIGTNTIKGRTNLDNDGFLIDPVTHEVVSVPKTRQEILAIAGKVAVSLAGKWSEEDIVKFNQEVIATNGIIKPVNLDLIHKIHNQKLTSANLAQWYFRELHNLKNWQIYGTYFSSLFERIDKSGEGNLQALFDNAEKYINELKKKDPNNDFITIASTIFNLYQAQHQTFGIKYPSLSLYFGNIVINPKEQISALQINGLADSGKISMYGVDKKFNQQPFTNPISNLGEHFYSDKIDGLEYQVLDASVSSLAKNQMQIKTGDVIKIDLSTFGLKGNFGFKIKEYVDDDSVLNEGFFNKQALYDLLTESKNQTNKLFIDKNLDNTIYSKSDIPYFVQNINIPHRINDGGYVDDYLYKADSYNFEQKTVALVSAVFARTVNEYKTLVTRLIWLLIILCLALSLIIITLILFENKKTILLFKAMGYRKRDIIWYLISGYLIAAIMAFLISIGLSALLIHQLAPAAEENIFLQLHFSSYWLFYLIGIFETLFFMAMVIISVVTYTRFLKPKDAFATL